MCLCYLEFIKIELFIYLFIFIIYIFPFYIYINSLEMSNEGLEFKNIFDEIDDANEESIN